MAMNFTVVRKGVRPNTGVKWFSQSLDDDELQTFKDWRKANWEDTGFMEAGSDVESGDGLTLTTTRKFETRSAATAYLAESNVQAFITKRNSYDSANNIIRSKVSAKGEDASKDKTSW